jgi:hypothetical protein
MDMEKIIAALEAVDSGVPGDHSNRMDTRLSLLEDVAKAVLEQLQREKAIEHPPWDERPRAAQPMTPTASIVPDAGGSRPEPPMMPDTIAPSPSGPEHG